VNDLPGEVGKVATSAIDAMKASPALLALILLQVMTLVVLYFAAQHNQERLHERELLLLRSCFSPSTEDRR
jgi:hypothetical protein